MTKEHRTFRCPACRETYSLRIALGQKVQCVCGNRFFVTEEDLVSGESTAADSSTTALTRRDDEGALKQGDAVGHCRIVRKLGSGSMGTVYLARHTVLDIQVAVKVLNVGSHPPGEFVQRFLREARTSAELDHPNVVRVLDCGTDRDLLYLTMEFVEGGTVADMLQRERRLDVPRALAIAQDVAKALVEADRHGVVHRDIKPENIMLTTEGAYKLADLGLAKHLPGASKTGSLTRPAVGMGTPHYMPPEQARDASHVDQRADIYALGATLYHLLAGRPPFPGKNMVEVLQRHLRDPLPPLPDLNRNVSETVFDVVQCCMAKKPDDRYQNAAELLHDLDLLTRTPAVLRSTLIAGRKVQRAHRRRRLVLFQGGMAAAILGMGGLLLWVGGRADVGPDMAESHAPTPSETERLRDEMRSLFAGLKQSGDNPVTQLRLWGRLAEVYSAIGDHDGAFQCFCKLALGLGGLAPEQRQALASTLNRGAVALAETPTAPPQAVQQRMGYARGLCRELIKPERLIVPERTVAKYTKELGIYGRIRPLPDYWLAFQYTFRQRAELSDFHKPRIKALSGQAEQRTGGPDSWRIDEGRLRKTVAGRIPLLWRVPHGGLLRVEYAVEASRADETAVVFRLGSAPGWAYLPIETGLEVSAEPVQGAVRVVVRAGGTVLAQDDVPPRPNRTCRINLTMAFPEVTVRANGNTLYVGRLPEVGLKLPGFLGLSLPKDVALHYLGISLPLEDATLAARFSPPHFYPLTSRGTRRFDSAATLALGTLGMLDPQKRPPKLLPVEQQRLSAADGTSASVTAPSSDSMPAAVLWFPVARSGKGRGCELRAYLCSRHIALDGSHHPGVLELLRPRQGNWLRFRHAGSQYSEENECFISDFRLSLDDDASVLNIYHELILRHYAPEAAGGTVEVDHALLVASWSRTRQQTQTDDEDGT